MRSLKQLALVLASCGALLGGAQQAQAQTTTYSFSGLYYVAGGAQNYTGSFSIVDPQLTSTRPWMAPDLNTPTFQAVWQGTSVYYTGGLNLDIQFASGSHLTASNFEIVVNNTTFQGVGSPYPDGLSVQLYPGATSVSAPTQNVCATPTGSCGEDDDPLYHDATQVAIMAIDSVYFAFYQAPLQSTPGMPNLVDHFGLNGGLGIRSGPTTTLTQFKSFSAVISEVTPVPEPHQSMLWLSGLAFMAALAFRRYPR